jgi:hypothetical protein
MGNVSSNLPILPIFISYENIQLINDKSILINTLPVNEQECLIKNTLNADDEVIAITKILDTHDYENIYIYGKNNMDKTVIKKYDQLLELGLKNVYIYGGGLFEWLLLQDIYGDEMFPTSSKDLDILKYRPKSN